MTAAPTILFALACGVDGAYVDVTDDVLFEEGDVPFTEGRAAEFDDIRPGTFSFTLANGDGKYTPDNLSTSLATPFSEGMGAVLQIGDLLISGNVRSLVLTFPPMDRASEARVRVTVDDLLSTASRREFGDYADLTSAGSVPEYWWPLDDLAGSTAGRFLGTANDTLLTIPAGGGTFGASGITGVSERQLQLVGTAGSPKTAVTSYFGTGSGVIGVWLTVDSVGDAYVTADVLLTVSPVIFGIEGVSRRAFMETASGGRVYGPTVTPQVPYYFSIRPLAGATGFGLGIRGRLNEVEFGALDGGSAISGPSRTNLTLTSATTAFFSQLLMASLPYGVLAESTAQSRLDGIEAFTAGTITFDTFPTLSDVPFGAVPLQGQTALDALNDVIRAEQGYMWVETGGTALSPEPKIKIGERYRERPVDYSFSVSEIVDPIAFNRSLRTTISQFTANGPDASAIYQDASLIPLVGLASSSDSLLISDVMDLYAYASDRVSRGINHQIPILSITVEATSPQIDRWDDLCAIRQGHRIQVTGLPESQLGYDTWDGYVLGRTVVNSQDSRGAPRTFFTFNLAPWLPVAVYGTARYSAGGTLTLSGAVNSSATTFSVATTAAKLTTTPANFPFDIQIDNEVMTVTAATGATPQVFTVTRGANPAAHADGSNVDLANAAIVGTDRYAY